MGNLNDQDWPLSDPVVQFLDQFETTCLGWIGGGPAANPNQIQVPTRAGPLYVKLKKLVDEQRAAAAVEERKACAGCVPDNWLDALLTGPEAQVKNCSNPEIERLLRGVRDRIRARAPAKAAVLYPVPEGAREVPCRACGKPMAFVPGKKPGSKIPVSLSHPECERDEAGGAIAAPSHFTDCSAPERFSTKKGRTA